MCRLPPSTLTGSGVQVVPEMRGCVAAPLGGGGGQLSLQRDYPHYNLSGDKVFYLTIHLFSIKLVCADQHSELPPFQSIGNQLLDKIYYVLINCTFSLAEQRYECAECSIKFHQNSGHRYTYSHWSQSCNHWLIYLLFVSLIDWLIV